MAAGQGGAQVDALDEEGPPAPAAIGHLEAPALDPGRQLQDLRPHQGRQGGRRIGGQLPGPGHGLCHIRAGRVLRQGRLEELASLAVPPLAQAAEAQPVGGVHVARRPGQGRAEVAGRFPHPLQAEGGEAGRHVGVGVLGMGRQPGLQELPGLQGATGMEGPLALRQERLPGRGLDEGGRGGREDHRPAFWSRSFSCA